MGAVYPVNINNEKKAIIKREETAEGNQKSKKLGVH